jgi:integrase
MVKYEDEHGNPIITINAVSRLSETRAWYKVERRQTLIKAHQLKDWYQGTMQLNQETTRDYLHLILFTGLRRSEASRLAWKDVDFQEGTLSIPETKNNQVHTLPLSDFLRDLLKRREQGKSSPYVFPSDSERGYLIEPKTALKRVTELSGVPFTLHDLRRTFITIAESLDIPGYALKRLLNHKDPNDVTAGYIVLDINRLREPMQKISSYIKGKIQIHDDGDSEL